MKLRRNAKDPYLGEDELGNPVIRFVGLHPSDFDEIINNGENRIESLEETISEAYSICIDPYLTNSEKIDELKSLL